MIRKNNLEILKEENVDRIANMGGEMWDQLAPVFRYLSISMISEFEIESIKKDLKRPNYSIFLWKRNLEYRRKNFVRI